MTLALALAPWLLLAFLTRMALARRPRLSHVRPQPADHRPTVSVIVPARDEADNISACLATLINSDYHPREIIVVDDNSVDGTGEIARILAERSDGTVRLISGEGLPDGWLGKSWACWQGYQAASGELLLFTDADTRHDDSLVGRAVGALVAENADLVTVLPAQLMETFWERVVLPHIFMLLTLRFRDLRRVAKTKRVRNVFANGQFILIRREAYEAVGGHEAVRAEVVEDVCMAQRLKRLGRRIYAAHAEDLMETRMYRSLRGIVAGWRKSLAPGAQHTVPPWARPLVPWLLAAFLIGFWVVPPAVLVTNMFTPWAVGLHRWSLLVTAVSWLYWATVLTRFRVPGLHAILYPLGALIAAGIVISSALSGRRFLWKGRRYEGTRSAGRAWP